MKKEISYLNIQKNLRRFIDRWKDYNRNEKVGAQTYLNEFFESFGIVFDPNKLPYEFNTGDGFADCYLKGKLILEMKDGNKVKTKEDLIKCLPQAERYWKAKGKEVNYLVLSNFKSFMIMDTRDKSKSFIKLSELEKKLSHFSFLFDSSTFLIEEQEAVSRNATKIMGRIYKNLRKRLGPERESEIDTFVLQCVFCMFAEDVGFLPNGIFTNLVHQVKEGKFNSADLLTNLFKSMDEQDESRKQGSLFENVRWFNGPLFKIKPEIVLLESEINLLIEACSFDWGYIKPEIFGVLFESSTENDEKHENGMHFTSEEDILKIVKPCIVDYWQERFEECKTQQDFETLHRELKTYRVLDPACGSGNFLLVAYREIKRIEAQVFQRLVTLTGKSYSWVQNHMGYFPVKNMYGIEIKNFPTLIARVSLWIAKKMMQIELKLDEPDLPLESLNHIICGDALQLKWDDVDVVIGNPPFIGCKQIRGFRGDDYVKWLNRRFKDHNKMSDYCTYWYAKAIEDIREGVRVGLVSTNTVTQNNSREASLEKVVDSGGEIFNAISTQQWSGEAKVHVSIVNFVNKKVYLGSTPKMLDGKVCFKISTRLRSASKYDQDGSQVDSILFNKNKAFVGPVPNGTGFVLNRTEAEALIKKNKQNSKVIKRYLTGEDINHNIGSQPGRYIIDFQDWDLPEAKKYTEPFKVVESKVKPQRMSIQSKTKDADNYRKFWWKFARPQMKMRESVKGLTRFVVTSRVSKHPIFTMIENDNVLPADSTVIFASDDYGFLGVMQSRFHIEWYKYQCSTLKGDLRYTNTTVFETFPFPLDLPASISNIMQEIETYRKQACMKQEIGLTTLYNELKDGGHDLLAKLHRKLDTEVAKAYHFPVSKIEDSAEIINFLIRLNGIYRNAGNTKETAAKVNRALEKASTKSGSRKKKA